MSTLNNWLTTNLIERLTDKNVDFRVNFHTVPCQHLSFKEATNYNISKLPDTKKFVALSGGADSEYVVRSLYRNDVPFIPIIVYSGINNTETIRALKLCQELSLNPVILKVTEQEIIRRFLSDIYDKLNGIGIYSTPTLIAAEYAVQNGGILLTGDHSLDEYQSDLLAPAEWEYYNDVLLPESTIPFFVYTPEMLRAIASSIENFNEDKCSVYGVEKRPKGRYQLTNQKAIRVLRYLQQRTLPKSSQSISKREFFETY